MKTKNSVGVFSPNLRRMLRVKPIKAPAPLKTKRVFPFSTSDNNKVARETVEKHLTYIERCLCAWDRGHADRWQRIAEHLGSPEPRLDAFALRNAYVQLCNETGRFCCSG